MTLLDRILARGLEMPHDPIVAARLERHVRRIQPDPLFRRRLRSVVVNRYVATREGMLTPVARPGARRQMGVLGRGVLYASLLTAIGTTAVGAAAQDSLPGDALYGVKLELEQVRMQIAPPNLRDDLAAMALDERLEELERLASAGRWDLVDEAAERAAAAERALAAFGPDAASDGLATAENAMKHHAERLQQLMSKAPASARDELQRGLDASTPAAHQPNGPSDSTAPRGGGAPTAPRSTPVPSEEASPTESQPSPSAGPHAGGGDAEQGGDSEGGDGGTQQSTKGDVEQ